MIRFNFLLLGSDDSKLKNILCHNKYTYPEILEVTGEFQIIINGKTFFLDLYFPVLEFLKDALEWAHSIDASKNMSYSSIETEENPLIVFSKKDDGWTVFSPWQKYECTATFTRDEVTNAVLHLAKALTQTNY